MNSTEPDVSWSSGTAERRAESSTLAGFLSAFTGPDYRICFSRSF
jgi:hypothetical protein